MVTRVVVLAVTLAILAPPLAAALGLGAPALAEPPAAARAPEPEPQPEPQPAPAPRPAPAPSPEPQPQPEPSRFADAPAAADAPLLPIEDAFEGRTCPLTPGTFSNSPQAGPLDELLGDTTACVYEITGENLTREDIRVVLDMEFRDIDIDLWGVVFGSGKFEAQARVNARVEFRALSVGRIEEAVNDILAGTVNLSDLGLNLSRQYLSADEFRLLLAGEALAAFESEQERKVTALVGESFPSLTILSTRFNWRNTDPWASLRNPPGTDTITGLKEPPIVLEAVIDFQHLERRNLVEILEDRFAAEEDDARAAAREAPGDAEAASREALLRRLRDENEGAFYERSAFSVFGITQLLILRLPPGWDLTVSMRVPTGYTFEYASPDVLVDETQTSATVVTLARESGRPVENPAAISLSNRNLVAMALLIAVGLAGMALRVPVLLVANRMRRRRGHSSESTSFASSVTEALK